MNKKNKIIEYKKELFEVFSKISKDKKLFEDFLTEITTPRELENMSVRWQIVKRIGAGEHHQAIAEDLHLGVATVTRGSREMRNKEGGFQKALKVIHK